MFIPVGVLILILVVVMVIIGDAERSARSSKSSSNPFDAPIDYSSIIHRKEDGFYTPDPHESEEDKIKRDQRIKENKQKLNANLTKIDQLILDLGNKR